MKKKDIYRLFDGRYIYHTGKHRYITGISNNSRKLQKGELFFAIKGSLVDGHRFVFEAAQKGAYAVAVSDRETARLVAEKHPVITVILHENTRVLQAETARRFFDFPDKKLAVIGITGTNGKTTTAHLIAQYLQIAGKKTGIIGTLGYKVGDRLISEGRTTPDAIEWFGLLKQMQDMGVEYVVAEVSSHALDQYRVYGTEFKGAVFTNLSEEHLDYHRDMEDYFRAKERLIRWIPESSPVAVNLDDMYGRRLYDEYSSIKNVLGYGRDEKARLRLIDWKLTDRGTLFNFSCGGKKYAVETGLIGEFNVYNTAGAILLMAGLGFPVEFLVEKAKYLRPVRGRFEVLRGDGFTVVIDYAHTPDALRNVLSTLNKLKKGKIITVFGAGGDRDRSKRPLMGQVAQELSDLVVVTSDNPRTEEPEKIIQDILKGIKDRENVIVQPDREEAIKKAIYMANRDDIVLIAGKGHETYQIIGDMKIPFDDKAVALKYINLKS
ncbi:UDP-N-acetylmuramoyl-L-alanyl-D-glutamate--2,6-diaminopimelate ligase [Persephonella sp.]